MLKRVGVSFSVQAASLGVLFADRVLLVGILVRAWGADLYSDWATLAAAAGLLGLGELGLNVYFGNRWQEARALQDTRAFHRLLCLSLLTYASIGLGLAAIILGVYATIDLGTSLSLRTLTSPVAGSVFAILAGTALLRILRGSISQIYRGRGDFAIGFMIDTIPRAITVLAAGTAAWFGAGVIDLAVIYLLTDLIGGWLAMVADLRRRYPGLATALHRPTAADVRDLVQRGKWHALQQAATIGWLHLPVLLIGGLGYGGAALVTFVLARTLVNLLRQLATMLTTSLGVEIVGALYAGNSAAMTDILPDYSRLLCAITGAIAAGLIVFAKPLLELWTGRLGLVDVALLAILLAPAILVTPSLPLTTFLTLGGSPAPVALALLAQVTLGLGAAVALSGFGVHGVAAGLALGEALALGFGLPLLARSTVASGKAAHLVRNSLIFAGAGAWSGAAGALAVVLLPPGMTSAVVLALAVWVTFGLLPVAGICLPSAWRRRLLSSRP